MSTISILYVEDNDDLRESIAMVLEGPGREIGVCTTGEEALEALGRRDWDLLITDVSLPGISGTELARRVMVDKPLQWVVLCSGYEMHDGLAALGPNVRALTKPFELEALEQLIEFIIGRLKDG